MSEDPYERRVVHEEVVRTPEEVDARVVESATRVEPSRAESQINTLYRLKQLVWLIIGTLVVLIALRFILLVLGANLSVGFGAFLYGITQPFVAPFLPLFNEQQSQIQFSNLVAIVVYLLIGWGITKLLEILLLPRTPTY